MVKKNTAIEKKPMPKNLLAEDGFAVFASRPAESRGRLYNEPPSKTRDDFHRDRDRIIHSQAFRRLKFKTQVFVYFEGDHYRTRLSHSIEVAQVARALSRSLRLNEDLAETCALAHDLGHTPFAHVGEDALKECMEKYGGFDHNDQTLRVVTMLEKRYPRFDGLNLTWESLEGLIKHNGPVMKKGGKKKKLEITLEWLKDRMDLKLDTYASMEAQVAAIADDVAYNSHDLDDGLAAGLFTLKELEAVPLIGAIMEEKRRQFSDVSDARLIPEMIREVMGIYIQDVLATTRRNIAKINPRSADDVRYAGLQMVGFSDEMEAHDKELRAFLWEHFYRHNNVARMRRKVYKVVQDLFAAFIEHPRCLPPENYQQFMKVPKGWIESHWQGRTVADYIANMTDRLALLEHRRLFDVYQEIR